MNDLPDKNTFLSETDERLFSVSIGVGLLVVVFFFLFVLIYQLVVHTHCARLIYGIIVAVLFVLLIRFFETITSIIIGDPLYYHYNSMIVSYFVLKSLNSSGKFRLINGLRKASENTKHLLTHQLTVLFKHVDTGVPFETALASIQDSLRINKELALLLVKMSKNTANTDDEKQLEKIFYAEYNYIHCHISIGQAVVAELFTILVFIIYIIVPK